MGLAPKIDNKTMCWLENVQTLCPILLHPRPRANPEARVLKQFFIEENREAHTGSVRCELSNEPPDIARLLRFDKL